MAENAEKYIFNFIVRFFSILLSFVAFCDAYVVYRHYTGLFQKKGTYLFLLNIIDEIIFTFFYISRRKYWFRANFRFPVFDGFTRFGMS